MMPAILVRSWSPIGVGFDGRFITAAQLSGPSKAPRLEAAVRMLRPHPGQAMDQGETGLFREALQRKRFRGNRIVLGLPQETLLTGVLELPSRCSGAPVEDIARAELARMHDYDVGAAEVACWDLPASARIKDATQVMALACRHVDAEPILEAFEAGGLEVRALDSRPQALARACRAVLPEEGITAILAVEWDWALLILMYEGVVIYERMMPEAAIGQLAAAMSRRLGLEEDSVDLLLGEVGLAPGTLVELIDAASCEAAVAIVRGHLDAISAELNAPFTYAMHQYPGARAAGLLLTGMGAAIPGVVDHFRSLLQVDVRGVSPGDVADCAPALGERSADPALVTAIGLAEFAG